ncbi:MAG TPA: hypothetical protein VGZ93_11730 [Candidatus Methylacidiphilales bacterium]|jgi:hypothetical protein|nr:hypothetical protein [Candidatus Methylacidiphilales bacterium]
MSAIVAGCCQPPSVVAGHRPFKSVVVENYQVVLNGSRPIRVFIDMNASSSISVRRLQPVLERAMRDYQPLTSQAAILESLKPIILGFRAKRAAYQTIRELLEEHGIHVSDQAVIRFCRKYSTEIKRLSQGFQAPNANETMPAAPTILPASNNAGLITTHNPASQPQKKMRSLRGPV